MPHAWNDHGVSGLPHKLRIRDIKHLPLNKYHLWLENEPPVLILMFVLQRHREECERKAHRGEMDPRLEYTFQLLIDATGLSRRELMDYIFDGNMVCLPLHSHPFMKSGLRNLYSDLHRLICKSVMKWSFNNLKI